jgi:hypothetical protein
MISEIIGVKGKKGTNTQYDFNPFENISVRTMATALLLFLLFQRYERTTSYI